MSASIEQSINRAIQLHARGRLDEASELCRKLLRQVPTHPDLHHLYGVLLTRSGNFAAAEKHLNQSLQLRPDTPQYLNSLGMLYRKTEAAGGAEQCFQRSMSLAPAYPDPVMNLGNLRAQQERYDEAIALLRKAVALSPGNPAAHLNLGNAYKNTGRLEESADCYRESIRLNPDYALAYYNLALTQKMLGQYTAALESVGIALARLPGHVAAAMLAGEIHEHLGNLEQAQTYYQRCAESPQGFASACWSLANLGTHRFSTAETHRMQQAVRRPGSETDRIFLHFSLAKALEQQREYAESFAQLQAGNQLKRERLTYSIEHDRTFFAQQKQVFNQSIMQAWPRHGLLTASPIFIVGLPRSGTSLVEQILSGHRQVAGGGELETSMRIVSRKLPEMTGKSADQALLSLEPKHLRPLGEYYLSDNQQLARMAEHFTDKLPFNFALLGLLACIFPNAKFVHVFKHPLDACLGCFKQLFTRGQLFSYDLQELTDFYIEYARMMQHWKQAVPGRICDVSYEHLVTNPVEETRRLLAFLGLPWQEDCTDLQRNKRLVKTASAGQVRSGINQFALNRWRHYAAELQPVADRLRAAGCEMPAGA
jgi:tetratricopeptide (TPR) repeat protein